MSTKGKAYAAACRSQEEVDFLFALVHSCKFNDAPDYCPKTFTREYCMFCVSINLEGEQGLPPNSCILVGEHSYIHDRCETVSMGRLVDIIRDHTPFEIELKHQNNKVIVRKDGSVTYGCTTIESQMVSDIITARNKLLKQA